MLFIHHDRWKRQVALCMLLLIMCVCNSHAGNTPPGDTSKNGIVFTGATDFAADSSSFVVPFSRTGNLILVQARVDSMEGNFILDTGCPHLVLNLTYFRDYPTTYSPDEENRGVTGEIGMLAKTVVKRFRFGTLVHNRVDADLVNLGHIENTKKVRILGLIGVDLLRQCEVIIDYEKSLLYVHVIGKKESNTYKHEMLSDTATYHTVPVVLTDSRIVVHTEMAGKKIRLIIDSGAETNLLDSRLPDKVFENMSITGRVILRGAGATKIEALTGDLKLLQIGKQSVADLPFVIANLEKTCFSLDGCVDGILGFDFLSLQKIGFNFVNRKMYIWK